MISSLRRTACLHHARHLRLLTEPAYSKDLCSPSSALFAAPYNRRNFAQHVNDGSHSWRVPPTSSSRSPRGTPSQSSDSVIQAVKRVVDRNPERPHVPRRGSAWHIDIDSFAREEFSRLMRGPPSESASLAPSPLSRDAVPSLNELLAQYSDHAGRVLKRTLPNESIPKPHRRLAFDEEGQQLTYNRGEFGSGVGAECGPIALVAHVAVDETEGVERIAISSGFFIDSAPLDGERGEDLQCPILVSCAHTLEQMKRYRIHETPTSQSATLIFAPDYSGGVQTYYASSILSSLPMSDLVLYSITPSASSQQTHSTIRTLPVDQYPAHEGTRTRMHTVSFPTSSNSARSSSSAWDQILNSASAPSSTPFSSLVSSTWLSGTVLGYRDRAGSEVHPGTYDSLAHMLFHPLPTFGSSGGPILDEGSGAVVGIVTGDVMVNRVEGRRGTGTPGEALFELFTLPGLPTRDD